MSSGYGDAIGQGLIAAMIFIAVIALLIGAGAVLGIEYLYHHLHITFHWSNP